MRHFLTALVFVLGFAMPGAAQTPQDVVRWIYVSLVSDRPWSEQGINYLAASTQRGHYFTPRLVALFDADDTYGDDMPEQCLSWNFAVPGNDFDAAEIVQTLRLTTQTETDRVNVTAEFANFGLPVRIVYVFRLVEGVWKIDDVLNGDFVLSEVPCRPKAAPVPAPENAYCYSRGDDALKVELLAGNRARIELSSWQGGGHFCGGRMEGHQVADGWHFPGTEGCFLRLTLGGDGTLNITDPDWACKTTMCGQRAVLDGLQFPRSSQVACTGWQGLDN